MAAHRRAYAAIARRRAAPPRGGLVGGIIIDDQMQVEIGQRPLVDGLEKAEELAMPVAGHAFADDGAVEHVERREQGRGAVALVVMRHRPAAALLHRQARLGAVKGLDLVHMGICGSRCSGQDYI